MTRILFTFLCVIWSSELCKGQEALSVEESTPEPFQAGELFSNGERKKRQVTIDTHLHRKWSHGVYYVFNSTMSDKMKECFRKAAEVWSRDTCINFKEREIDSTYGYLFVTDDGGYYSHVGRLGDEQPISICKKCDKEIGRVIHEVGHALGLYHAHSRYDRDKYVTVMPDAMEKFEKEFEIIEKENLTDYGTEYDYGSIMHYASGYDNKMLVPADKHYRQTMGSAMLSFTDLWLINTHYGCLGRCEGTPITCENGGFPHPRDCNNKCICPSGYGGSRCDGPGENGQELNATAEQQELPIILESSRTEDYSYRTYWIKSPENTVIEIEIESIQSRMFANVQGCTEAGVEIKTNENQNLTGYRLCSDDFDEDKLYSHSNLVPVIAYNKDPRFTFVAELKYRYVDAHERKA